MRTSNFSLLQAKNGKSNENGNDLTDFEIYLALDLEIGFWSAEADLYELVWRSSKPERTH